MKYFIALSVALLTLLSCASMKGGNKALETSEWALVAIQGFQMENIKENVSLKFNVGEKRVHGFAGCNGFGGQYNLEGKAIKFTNLLSTQKGCTIGTQTENQYMKALNNVDGYLVKDDKLFLTQAGKTLLEFKKITMAKK